MIQGSEEWRAVRCGKVTASRIGDIMARNKSGYAASRKNYLAELVVERLTARPADGHQTAAMQWGVETEAAARSAYSFYRDKRVQEVGFLPHPSIAGAGASPDGLVGEDGLVEFKCPNTSTHVDALLGASIPRKYLLQMQWQMACTDRQWCDYVSYDPRLGEEMSLLVKHVPRDAELIEEAEAEVRKFLAELNDKVTKLKTAFSTSREDAA